MSGLATGLARPSKGAGNLGQLGIAPFVIPLITLVTTAAGGILVLKAETERRRQAEILSRVNKRETEAAAGFDITKALPIVAAVAAGVLLLK